MPNHLEDGWFNIQLLGDVFADLYQRRLTGRTSTMFRFMNHLDPRQMRRQRRPARMRATRGRTGGSRVGCRLLGRQLGFHGRHILIQVFLEQGLLFPREGLARRTKADST